MKLFELVLYQSCNYKCVDCPMAKWLYEPDELFEDGSRKNSITNDLLLEWLDKYLDPKEWFIEITGGEPGLYPEIEELISSLSKKGYKGIIRTNGSTPIPYSDNFKRVTAWHKEAVEFPKYYDFILILENPDEDWRKKETYCKENNIPHVVFPYKFFSIDGSQTKTYPPKTNGIFREMVTMFSSGAIGGCFSGEADSINGAALRKMSEPVIKDLCGMCGNIEAIEYFINNIPGFRETLGITDKDIPPAHCIAYPLLTVNNKWVDKEGNVIGVLGEDMSRIPIEKVFA